MSKIPDNIFIPWLHPFTDKSPHVTVSAIRYDMKTFHNMMKDSCLQKLLDNGILYVQSYSMVNRRNCVRIPPTIELDKSWAKVNSITPKGVNINILDTPAGRILWDKLKQEKFYNIYATGRWLINTSKDDKITKSNPRLQVVYFVQKKDTTAIKIL